jgi:AraC-like DNA-binding protein
VAADVLSDVLSAVRLRGSVFFDFELSSPWVLEAPPSHEIAATVMPGAERVIEFHLVVSGACWGHAVGGAPMRLVEGDLIVFPQGAAHVMSSAPGMRNPTDASVFERSPSSPKLRVLEAGGGGPDRARIVCCFLGCDERPFNTLLAALPEVIHLSASSEAGGGWLRTLVSLAARESGGTRAGSENVLARLSELMFVETIRRYLETLPAAETGWLAGVRDREIGQALNAIHRDARAAWTVEELARVAGMSRSMFAERFTTVVGESPMQYLALWRMQLAARLLADGAQVSAAADSVGYASEAAFSRAFKKLVGQSPALWKRGRTPFPQVSTGRGQVSPSQE